jgi:multidrug transporter EmrE-like cation transporter
MKYVLILTMAVVGTGANVLLKLGIQSVKGTFMCQDWIRQIELFVNTYIVTGLLLYVISALLWMRILSAVDLSYGFPLVVTLTICLVSIASSLIFREQMSITRILGIMVLCIGIILVAKS